MSSLPPVSVGSKSGYDYKNLWSSTLYWGDKFFWTCGLEAHCPGWRWGVTTDTSSIEGLARKVRNYKGKTQVGSEYPPALSQWKSDLSRSAVELRFEREKPTQASFKNGDGKTKTSAQITSNNLEILGDNVSRYVTFLYLHPDKNVASSEILGVVGEIGELAKKGPVSDKEQLRVYFKHFGKKLGWGFLKRQHIRFRYWYSASLISNTIQSSFYRVLKTLRGSSDEVHKQNFENLLGHIHKFLQDYNAGNLGAKRIEGKDFPALCQEISPLLIKHFYPEVSFFEKWSEFRYTGWVFKVVDFVIMPPLNALGRWLLSFYLPDILQGISKSVVDLTVSDPKKKESSVNLLFANPILSTVNRKLDDFLVEIKKVDPKTDKPLPEEMGKNLTGVVDQLMLLAGISQKGRDGTIEYKNKEDSVIADGLRTGLIGGGYRLQKYLQKQPETLLSELFSLANNPFLKKEECFDEIEALEEHKHLKEEQTKLLGDLCDEIFGQVAFDTLSGVPSEKVRYHLIDSREQLTSYLREALEACTGLQSDLKRAEDGLLRADYEEFPDVLTKHVIVWDEISEKLGMFTHKDYPKVARKTLLDEFSPLCLEGARQVDLIDKLRDTWILYTSHRKLEKLFQKLDLSDPVHFTETTKEIKELLEEPAFEARLLSDISLKLPEIKKKYEICRNIQEFQTISVKTDPYKLDELLAKNPILQKEVGLLVKELKGLDPSLILERKRVVEQILEITNRRFIEQRDHLIQEQTVLLHDMYPSKQILLKEPMHLKNLESECRKWIQRVTLGYQSHKEENLLSLQEGVRTLKQQRESFEAKIALMEPTSLGFPVEFVKGSIFNWSAEKLAGKLKESLKQSVLSIVGKVGSLLMAKTKPGEENLYSWIEKVAFYESIQHLNKKK